MADALAFSIISILGPFDGLAEELLRLGEVVQDPLTDSYIVVGGKSVLLVSELHVLLVEFQTFLILPLLVVSHPDPVQSQGSPHWVIEHPRTEKEPLEELHSLRVLVLAFIQTPQAISHVSLFLDVTHLDPCSGPDRHVLEGRAVDVLVA